jgi:uncharacterized membrane protein YdjX (TVP38/TMEM64 family)
MDPPCGNGCGRRPGLQLVVITSLSSDFRFWGFNLAYGLRETRLRDYTIDMISILAGTILFVAWVPWPVM